MQSSPDAPVTPIHSLQLVTPGTDEKRGRDDQSSGQNKGLGVSVRIIKWYST